jgi:hypothetical protein
MYYPLDYMYVNVRAIAYPPYKYSSAVPLQDGRRLTGHRPGRLAGTTGAEPKNLRRSYQVRYLSIL